VIQADLPSTRRLKLRKLTAADAEALFAYRSDPEVARYQNWEPASVEELRSFLESLSGIEPLTWFQVGIELRETGDLIGDCGIRLTDAANRCQAEIGITLASPFQGRGLASEALWALLGHLFLDLGLHRVFGSVDPRNLASMRLLQRVGMRQEAHCIESYWAKGEWADDVIFAILRREWTEAQGSDHA
jgi:RimJ/RimL family protein N-acetyltransferase